MVFSLKYVFGGERTKYRTKYRTLTNIDKYYTDIDEYCQFLQERSLFRNACRISFGEFGLWATRCTDLPPICIRMHPYAPIRLIYALSRLVTPCSTQVSAKKVKISKNR